MPLRPALLDESLIGRSLPWDLYTAAGVLVARAGLEIAGPAQLARLNSRPLYRRPEAQAADSEAGIRLRRLLAELPRTLQSAGTPELEAGIRAHARTLITLAHLDHDALLGLARLLPMRDPAVRHCLIAAVIALDLGESAGMRDDAVESLVAAALTMNLAALRLHAELSSGMVAFDAGIGDDIHRHPERGALLLEAGGLTDAGWLAAVRQHHENQDGSGYPLGLRDEEICLGARILRVVDFYVAKISGRRYRPPRSAKFALKEIFGSERGRLDSHLAIALLRRHGTHPAGTLVRLASREVAVVIRHVGQAEGASMVVSFMEQRGRLLKTPIERNTSQASHAIQDVMEADARWPEIRWETFWGY